MPTRKIIVREVNTKHALGISKMKELNYVFNPYLGCFHGCLYCYAIDLSNSEISNNWGNIIYVRKNILEILKREIHTYKRGVVGISSITDPYHAVEGKYRITANAVDFLASNGFYVTVQTKSPLALRDLDIYIKHRKNVDIGYTITSLKNDISRKIEPYAPLPETRLGAIKKFSRNGINSWIFMGPIIKNINDNLDDIEGIIKFASDNDIRIIYDFYKDYPGSKKYMANTGYSISDDSWLSSIESNIKKIAGMYNVKCINENDEWEYEFYLRQKTLF